jgi:transcriptional regulator with XRE-family HTH domain
MATSKTNADTVATFRDKLRQAAKDSDMTQEEIGLRMGFPKSSARQAVSRLLNAEIDYDPRLSTLLMFTKAIGKSLKEIV